MTRALHLDPGFRPYATLGVIPFEAFTFSGGEPHVKLGDSDLAGAHVHVTHRAKTWNDLGLLATACDALRRAGAASLELTLPYFPGARQDRVMVAGEALTVKVYAGFLNALAFTCVTVFDPHSEVAPALLDRPRVVSNVGFAKAVLDALPADTLLVSPDAGAQKKVYKVAQALAIEWGAGAPLRSRDVVEGGKRRDVKTGALSGFHVYGGDLGGRPCLLLDDVCDGGGTFLGLAEALKAKGAGELYLAVSHGIFSKGMGALSEVFTKVYCTDAFDTPEAHDSLDVVPLAGLLP